MTELIIKGTERKIEKLYMELRIKAKRNNLEMSISDNKAQEVTPLAPTSTAVKETAKEVADKIEKCTSITELESFKDDPRQIVKNAYNKKLKELE